jgi:hypothetical protein
VLDCWDHRFELPSGHGSSFPMLVVCCVGCGLCDEPITRSEESYWFVCVYNLVMSTGGRTRSDLGCRAAAKEEGVLSFFHSTHET